MTAYDTATSEIQPPTPDTRDPASGHPTAGEVTEWLLEGGFFTIGTSGAITTWSPAAEEAFGWGRKEILGSPFAETLLAPAERPDQEARVAKLFVDGAASFTGTLDALDSAEHAFRATFALVPIHLGVGYEFNKLLQEVATRAHTAGSPADLKRRHESVLALIEDALSGRTATAGETEERARLAGALVVFRAASDAGLPGDGSAVAADAPLADNVVSIADAGGTEETRTQLDRARRETEAGRVEIRSLEGQLEEARREAQRARNEVDVARQAAGDARDSLTVALREAEEARRQLEDSKRIMDEVRATAEAARIRSEQAEREADSQRALLREARESARGLAGRADDDLARAQEEAAHAGRELIEARAENARLDAEVAPLRERYQAAQRELGTLRADLESARASAVELQAATERRAADLERLRAEVETRAAEAETARGDGEELRSKLLQTQSELTRAEAELAERSIAGGPEAATHGLEPGVGREELDRLRVAFDQAPVGSALLAPDGTYLDVNDALCEALGQPRETLLADEPPVIVHPEDADSKRELAERMLAGRQAAARGVRRYLHADGHLVQMRENMSLVRDAEGRPSLFVVQLEELAGDADEAGLADADVAESTDLVGASPEYAMSSDSLRRALEDDMFQLYCQPVLDLHANSVSQYELLIRMVAEDGRVILPKAFLSTARRAGLAHAIDRWVVRHAIRLLHERQSADEDVSFEVNLSPEAIHDDDLPAMIEEELASTPIDPARLVLELTGATAAGDIDATRDLARRLRGLGCRFALDDFRSNFGSFRLLKDIPLDYLKLDGELVGSLTESRTSQLIVKALVDVAAGTGMKTVAVFVSDDSALAMLRDLGVDYAQGYKVGRPRPVSEVFGGPGTRQLSAG
jgi:PAS domain S-box-containing protein